MLEPIKQFLTDQAGLPPASVLIAGGVLSHLALNALLRKPMASAWGIVAPVVLGLALEAYEIWVEYRRIGLFAEGNDPIWVILARHGIDVVIMVAGPVLLVGAGFFFNR